MTMTHDKMIEVIQAHRDGEKIERKMLGVAMAQWALCKTPQHSRFNFDEYDYRIKPEPREWWVNFYPQFTSGLIGSREAADTEAALQKMFRVKCVHVREVLP